MKNIFLKILEIIVTSPLSVPRLIFSKVICKIRSNYYSRKIDNGDGEIIFTDPFIRFKLKKHKSSELVIRGKLRIVPHIGGNSPIVILMGLDSKLHINGDFLIGNGVQISLSPSSILIIGGKDKESDSGITCDTLIMVKKRIEIGKDFLCAWNVFISDSDWHQIGTQRSQNDVLLGDHVWVANSCSILKGSQIGNNSIIASHSKVINKQFNDNTMIAGTPANVVKSSITWARDVLNS